MTMAVLARSGPGEASPPQRDVIRMTDASRSMCKLGLEGIGLRWQTHAREAQALLSLDSLHYSHSRRRPAVRGAGDAGMLLS